IIRELRNVFGEDQLCILSQDEYYRPREEQVWDNAGYQNFDLPQSIDHTVFSRDIAMLVDGREVVKEQYVFNNPNVEPVMLTFRPAPVLVIEGLFVFCFEEIRNLLDLKIFIDAEDVIKLKRRIIRDAGERNYPLEDVLHRYEHHVLPAYRAYIEPFRNAADIIINNHTTYQVGLGVIEAVIHHQLKRRGRVD